MKLKFNLQLFNEGGAAAGAGAPAAAGAPEAGEATNAGSMGGSSSRQQGPKVVYGKQQEAAAAPEGAATVTDPDNRKQEFERLIGEEYKDLFTERTQKIIDRRFKETKQLEAQMQALNPITEMLCERYGIKDRDVNKLLNIMENDDSYWEEAADEAGLTVDQYKHIRKMEKENEEFRRFREESQREAQIQESWSKILDQAESTKAAYPEFDLEVEFENAHFQSLIRSGVPVQTAYEVLHMDEVKASTAQSVEQKVTKNIRAKSQRPSENGLNTSGIIVKNDVSKLTKSDRAEIARRVARGEEISY